jgi:hypothetical protein
MLRVSCAPPKLGSTLPPLNRHYPTLALNWLPPKVRPGCFSRSSRQRWGTQEALPSALETSPSVLTDTTSIMIGRRRSQRLPVGHTPSATWSPRRVNAAFTLWQQKVSPTW